MHKCHSKFYQWEIVSTLVGWRWLKYMCLYIVQKKVTELDSTLGSKNAKFVYLECDIGIFTEFVLWFVSPYLTKSGILGTPSTVFSLSINFSPLVDLVVSGGGTRFLVKRFSRRMGCGLENSR